MRFTPFTRTASEWRPLCFRLYVTQFEGLLAHVNLRGKNKNKNRFRELFMIVSMKMEKISWSSGCSPWPQLLSRLAAILHQTVQGVLHLHPTVARTGSGNTVALEGIQWVKSLKTSYAQSWVPDWLIWCSDFVNSQVFELRHHCLNRSAVRPPHRRTSC